MLYKSTRGKLKVRLPARLHRFSGYEAKRKKKKTTVIALHINVKTILELPGPVSTCMHMSFTSSELHIIITPMSNDKELYSTVLC